MRNAVKCNDHHWDPQNVAVVDRWSLFRGAFVLKMWKMGLRNSGRCRQVVTIYSKVVVSSGLTAVENLMFLFRFPLDVDL